ncbi:MAG: hypothetical protein CL798_01305 [Chromatiales bacterium]|nr:hypothetical protein [Chromatiales bacterium]
MGFSTVVCAEYRAERGLDFPGLWIDNGAGLSRYARLAARSQAGLRVAVDHSIYRAEFVTLLAPTGIDGTLRRRFRKQSLAGHINQKTGRLDDLINDWLCSQSLWL